MAIATYSIETPPLNNLMSDADDSRFLKRPKSYIGSKVKASAFMTKIGRVVQMPCDGRGVCAATQMRPDIICL
jgi:hypothetical protein